MEQAKIRPSVTLYSLDRSLPNLVRLIASVTPTHMPILVKFGSVGNSPQIVKYNVCVTFCSVPFFSLPSLEEKPLNGFARLMAQNA